MVQQGDEVHVETDSARAGSTPHIVRWILIVGITLAIVLLSATWIIGALSQGEQGSVATATDRVAEQSRAAQENTDSIVSDDFDSIEAAPSAGGTPGADAADRPSAVEN